MKHLVLSWAMFYAAHVPALSGKAPEPVKSPVASPSPKPSPTPEPSPSASPAPPMGRALTESEVAAMVEGTPCARYSWKNRGKAPIGYVKGFAQVFARSLCNPSPLPDSLGSARLDALAAYGKTASQLNTYALLLGLGMRESSGRHCEGWDTSASSHSPGGYEAGLYQFSFNARSAVAALNKPDPYSARLRLIEQFYERNPQRCALKTFGQGVTCRTMSERGSPEAIRFQKLVKTCPAFAVEYGALLIRVLKPHFGPFLRREVEFVPACLAMLERVKNAVQASEYCANGNKNH